MQIIAPEQFDRLYAGLPNADMQLLVETDIETGMRWGELTELRVKDLDPRRRAITIARAVVQVNPKFHPAGQRFLVKDYPKDGEHRRVKISAQLVDKIAAHIDAEGLGTDDLLFELRDHRRSPTRRTAASPPPETLGFTEPTEKGHAYRHGSLSGYNAGRCRCQHCKDAYATYRAQRRQVGKDRSDRPAVPQSPRPVDTDGHIPRDWFRNQVWTPARNTAALPFHVRVHDLRHAHASWLVAGGGADLQAVKERLGHGSIRTTERYLHTLEDHDERTIEAFENIRYRSTNGRTSA